MRLSDTCNDRNNNICVMKFIAAILVIISHAYPLIYGAEAVDPLCKSLKGGITFGGVAVSVFFFLGGFLNCKSTVKSGSLEEYLRKRIIRIVPPLFFVSFILAFVMGAAVTSLSLSEYYSSKDTYLYLLNSIMILRHELPGVFTSSPYNSTVNGVLWTMPVEFICYIGCYILYKLGLLNEKKISITAIPIMLIYVVMTIVVGRISPLLASAIRPMMLFLIGMFCYIFKERIYIHRATALICLFVSLISCYFGVFDYIGIYFFAYFLLYAAFGTNRKLSAFGNRAEISYEIYLVAFPIQQLLSIYIGYRISVAAHIILVIVCSIIVGFIVWYICERPLINKRKETL